MFDLLAAGLSVIPTLEGDKRPAIAWEAFQTRRATDAEAASWSAGGLGVVCGAISGGLFCLDMDTKNDATGNLKKEYQELVREQAPDLIARMVVQQTPSGGWHLIARCKKSISNLKLARTKDRKVLLETRGEGGYFCAAPTKGYTVKRGKLTEIPEITEEELEILLDCARAFNQEEKEAPRMPKALNNGLSPLDAYDQRTTPEETAALLEAHGWKVVARRGEAIYLKRPDKKERGISATLNYIPGRFFCFSSSTLFETEHVYKPYAVYAMLEHGGDFHAAAKTLAAQGYGEKRERTKPPLKATPGSELAIGIRNLYHNGMRKGLSPGWPRLARIYQAVKGQLNIWSGIPSHGKSEAVDALAVNLAVSDGWKWEMWSPENHPPELHGRKIIEKYKGKSMAGPGRLTEAELEDGMEWLFAHFNFLGTLDEDVTLDSIFAAVEESKATRGVDGVVIDPWNELESSRPDKMTETEFIGLCLKRSRIFARKNDLHFNIVAHPQKQYKDKKTGEYAVPTLYDISGSAHWYNKADNGIVIHRDFTAGTTKFIVQKVKFKYYGKPGEVEMKYDVFSGRYTELENADYFKPAPPPRQLPIGDAEEGTVPF